MDYDKWPTKNPWKITSSTASDLKADDQVWFELDSSVPPKVFIKTVFCPVGHSPAHTGNDWKDQLCSKGTGSKKVSGTTKSSAPFVIQNSTDASGLEHLSCNPPGEGLLASWTAIEGGNGSGSGSGSGNSGGGGSGHGQGHEHEK